MTPKEKARELYDKYWKIIDTLTTKKCALISVDEVLENVNYFFNELEKDGLPNKFGDEIEYWESVKYEIKKL